MEALLRNTNKTYQATTTESFKKKNIYIIKLPSLLRMLFNIPCSQKQIISKNPPILRFFQVMLARNVVKISYDVSDETIKCSLVPHLSTALGRKGISVLTDKHDEFYESIASVLIFSKNLSSKETLHDFLKAIRRRHDKGHVVITVFYGVSRSNVHDLKGNFAEHRTTYQASQWRNALAEIATLPGHEESNNQSECQFVEKIARDNLPNQKIQQRVLVVLDDVRNHLHAESFLAGLVSFSPGSLIIITSRDEQVLSQCQVNETYKVEGLNKLEAMQLFSWCASERDVRETNHLTETSMKVIEYANGNPLALRVYGKEMSSQKQPSQKDTLFLKLKQSPPHQIMEVVKSSYYALSVSIKKVSKILQELGFFPDIGIDRLVENSLVTISENRLEMHSMIQDVVRNIGRCHQLNKIKEDPKTSFKCVLGTEDIEAISLDASNLNPYINDSNPGNHRKALESLSLPYGLRFLFWDHYPLQSLPQDFDPSNLVELNMPYSQLQTLWGGGTKNLKMLRRINLRHSQKLLEVDELSKARNLEEIDLHGCKNLHSLPEICDLHKLRVVDLPSYTAIELKYEGSSIETISPPVPAISVKSLYESFDKHIKNLKFEPPESNILDLQRFRSFFYSQEMITYPDMVEQPTFKNMVCKTGLAMSEWALANLRKSSEFIIKNVQGGESLDSVTCN
ncbi:unnamed protein product, partial [Thlaspi arvense]